MRTFIITPVGNNCNLRCDYCYHSNLPRMSLKIMTEEILERFIKESLSMFSHIRYIWHGGEPMLAGLNFFQKALFFQKKYRKDDQVVINGIQSNVTLVDDSWGKFFADTNFHVSTSLDGIKEVHNLHRDNSYDQVLKGIEILDNYLKRVGVILVVNKDNVFLADQIYKSFKTFSWFRGFELHPYMPVADSENKLVPNEDDLLNFMYQIFDLWWEDDNPKIVIRMFRDIIRVFLKDHPIVCASQRKGCLNITSVNYDGSIYTCSRFMEEKGGYLGNIIEDDLCIILQRKRTEKIYQQMVDLPRECLRCKWLDYCGGGCAYQRWLDAWSKYYQCNVRKELFRYVTSRLNNLKNAC